MGGKGAERLRFGGLPGRVPGGDAWVIALLTLLGVLVRAGHLATPYMDSDQAVFGLQALHVLKGEFPAFSWGYAYIGTLQTFIDAAFFALFGANRVVLNGVVLLFYAGYSVSLWHLSAALFPERRWRVLATALGAVAPGYFVHHGVWARHGYPETFFFGTLLLALMCNRLGPEERPGFYGWLLFVAGLAWWSNFLVLYYFLPLGVYLLYQLAIVSSHRARGRIALAATAGFLAGSLPFWVHNVRNGFDSLAMFRKAPQPRGPLEDAPATAWNTFTVLVGAREQGADYTVALAGPVLAVLSAAALLFFAVHRAAELRRIPARRRLAPGDILLAFLLTLPLVFAVSRQSLRGIRYLIPFYSLYPIYLTWALRALAPLRGGRWLVAGLTAFLFAMNTASALEWNPLLDPQGRARYRERAAADRRLFDDLERAGRRQALTYNYWDAYRLTFDAGERVIVDHVNSRHPEYLFDMFSAPVVSYLTRGGSPSFEAGAGLLGYAFARQPLETYVLYTDFRPAFPRDLSALPAGSFRLEGNQGRGDAGLLNDRLLSTGLVLTSGKEPPLPVVDIHLEAPAEISGLAIFPGTPNAVPPQIRVTDQETRRVLAGGRNLFYGYASGAHPYLPGASPILEVAFPPCRTRHLRVSFAGPSERRGEFSLNELVVFGAGGGAGAAGGSDEHLFDRIRDERGASGVFPSLAAVRPLERALGRDVAYARDRGVAFEERNLFVFEKEYLRHNLEVLDALGIAHESGAGEVFAFIATRGTGWGLARWVEKALFVAHDPDMARADYLKAGKLAPGDDPRAETLLRRALARDPDHFGSLTLLAEVAARRGDGKTLAEARARLDRINPAAGRRLEAGFGSAYELVSIAQDAVELRPGESVSVDVALTPRARLRQNSWVFLHFLSPAGELLFQSDLLLGPAGGPRLHPGDLVRQEHVVRVPLELGHRGPVGIWLGITKPGSRKRLEVRTPLQARGNRVLVGEITVRP